MKVWDQRDEKSDFRAKFIMSPKPFDVEVTDPQVNSQPRDRD